MFRLYKMMLLLFVAAVQIINVAASTDDGTQQEWGVDQWMASCNCKNDRNVELFKGFSAFSRELMNNCSNKEKRWKSEQMELMSQTAEYKTSLHQLNQSYAQAATEWQREKLDLSLKLQNNEQELAKLRQRISKHIEAEECKESLHQLNQSFAQTAAECRNEKLDIGIKMQNIQQELTKLQQQLNDQFIKHEALLEENQISIIDKTSYERITPICKAIYNAKCIGVRCYEVKLAQDMKEHNLLKAIEMYDELITKLTPCLNASNIQQLIDEKADIYKRLKGMEKSFLTATENGDVQLVKNLIAKGVNVNATNEYKHSGLMYATSRNDTAIVKLLIEAGVDTNIQNIHGESALLHAVLRRNLEVLKMLLENGADVNVASGNGNMPLHTAARYGYLDIAKILVEHGARLNDKNNEGRTPLGRALFYNQAQMVRYLMSIGATE